MNYLELPFARILTSLSQLLRPNMNGIVTGRQVRCLLVENVLPQSLTAASTHPRAPEKLTGASYPRCLSMFGECRNVSPAHMQVAAFQLFAQSVMRRPSNAAKAHDAYV